jgi:hypothetical protein
MRHNKGNKKAVRRLAAQLCSFLATLACSVSVIFRVLYFLTLL